MIEAIDGHKIVYIENMVDDSNAVVMCHGITSSKEEEGGFYNLFADKLNDCGLSTIRFDFRGHGESKIKSYSANISGMIADLHCVLDYSQNKYKRISILAASFGASILLLLMQQRNLEIQCAVLLNPVLDYLSTFTECKSEWSRSYFPSGGLSSVLTNKNDMKMSDDFLLNPLMAVEFFYYKPQNTEIDNEIPILIMHGDADKIVSVDDSRGFVKTRNSSNIELIEFKGASHGLEESRIEVIERFCKFIKRHS